MVRYVVALWLFLMCTSYAFGIPTPVDQVVSKGSLENLLLALEKLMFFFYKRFDKLNVDGLFGVRVVEGELQRSLEKNYPKLQENPGIKDKMNKILELATKTAKLAMPYVKEKDEEYFQNFLPVIVKPYRSYELSPQLLTKVGKDELPWTRTNRTGTLRPNTFDEKESDRCMGIFLGDPSTQKCELGTCWKTMTKLDTVLYYTTHQLLWLQLGIRAGCQFEIETRLASMGGLHELLKKLCNNVIFTMETLAENDVVDYLYQDLFLEQGMICGSMGFMDAVRQNWLTMALRWQHPALGCFREFGAAQDPSSEYEDLDNKLFAKKGEWAKRRLLMDVDMGDRCSAHKSAVAAGFLAVYARLYIDPDYIESKLMPYLYGADYLSPKAARKRRIRRILVTISICSFILIVLAVVGPRRFYSLCAFYKQFSKGRGKQLKI